MGDLGHSPGGLWGSVMGPTAPLAREAAQAAERPAPWQEKEDLRLKVTCPQSFAKR